MFHLSSDKFITQAQALNSDGIYFVLIQGGHSTKGPCGTAGRA